MLLNKCPPNKVIIFDVIMMAASIHNNDGIDSKANTYDVTGNSLNLTRMLNGVTNYSTPNTYYAQTAATGRTIYTTFQLTYTLN